MALPLLAAIGGAAARAFAAAGGRAALSKLGGMLMSQGGRQAIQGGGKKAMAAFKTPAGRRKIAEAMKRAGKDAAEAGAIDLFTQAAQAIVGGTGAAGSGVSTGPSQTGPTAQEAAEAVSNSPRATPVSEAVTPRGEPRARSGAQQSGPSSFLQSLLGGASAAVGGGGRGRGRFSGFAGLGGFGRGGGTGGRGSGAGPRVPGGGFFGSPAGQYGLGAMSGGAAAMMSGGMRMSAGVASSAFTPGTAAVAQDAAGLASDGMLSLMTGNMFGFVNTLVKGTGSLEKWSKMLLESQRGIAQFSGAMAVVFARHESRNIRRAVESGNATAGSTGAVQDAMDDFNDAIQPLRDGITNLTNNVVAIGMRAVTLLAQSATFASTVAGYVVPGFGTLKGIMDWLNKSDGKAHGPFVDIMMRGAAAHDGGLVRPPRPDGPRGLDEDALAEMLTKMERRRRRR